VLLNRVLDGTPGWEPAVVSVLVVGLPVPVADDRPRDRVLDWGSRNVADATREVLRSSADRWRRHATGLDVIVDNDANLSAVAEHRWGVGVGLSDILYVKWSTGLGGGLILDGALRRGAGGAAGEFGHTPVPVELSEDLELCGACGQKCFEVAIGFKPLLKARGWGYRDVQAVARDPSHDDYGALSEWIEPRAELLGRALVPVVNAVNPELLVIDGILDEGTEPLFARQVQRSLEEHGAMAAVYSDLKVRGGRFTVSAAARGGLARALQQLAAPFLLAKGSSEEEG
jgi:predicted NBD/HSP70 family sugar kinase